jgi:hypothetical protein
MPGRDGHYATLTGTSGHVSIAMPEVCRSNRTSLVCVFMVNLHRKGRHTNPTLRDSAKPRDGLRKAKASRYRRAGGRSREDAMRTGSVTRRRARNPEDRWCWMSLTTQQAGRRPHTPKVPAHGKW